MSRPGIHDLLLIEAIGQCRDDGLLPRTQLAVAPLQGDGSDRKFHRLRIPGASYVMLIAPTAPSGGISENDSYFRIGHHLHSRGVPVPTILAGDPTTGWFLLEDIGDTHLQRQASRGGIDRSSLYRRAVRLLAHLHRESRSGFQASFCFDAPLYDAEFAYTRELEYFLKEFLNGHLQLGVGEEELRGEFEEIAEAAGATSCTHLIHRDFQSRNLMLHRGRLRLVDFQGMRYGPPAYDLASLLVDPYVTLSDKLQDGIVREYWQLTRAFLGCKKGSFINSYNAVRLCRNMQALGAYGFLGNRKGKRQFLAYVPRAWDRLRHWLDSRYPGKYRGIRNLVSLVDAGDSVIKNPLNLSGDTTDPS